MTSQNQKWDLIKERTAPARGREVSAALRSAQDKPQQLNRHKDNDHYQVNDHYPSHLALPRGHKRRPINALERFLGKRIGVHIPTSRYQNPSITRSIC